jgi:deoxyribonuclease V
MSDWGWPSGEAELVELQVRLAAAASRALAERPWTVPAEPLVAGCFVAYARGEAGPGNPGDRAWAAAVLWPAGDSESGSRQRDVSSSDAAHVVVAGRVPAAYSPGLLALREGPLLAEALSRLARVAAAPDVLMVDASGTDHPRRAGLAVHLGAELALPSVGVTHRPLVGRGDPPPRQRGSWAPVCIGPTVVGGWICTRTGARPVVAHAGWRTDPQSAAELVLRASTPAARTPVPLQEARRLARETRARAEGG